MNKRQGTIRRIMGHIADIQTVQRPYQRRLDKKICKTEMNLWAVLGIWGCREKRLPTAISMQLFEVVFSTFCGQKTF